MDMNSAPNCPDKEALAALADGRASASDRARLFEHLDSCEDCYEVFAETMHFLQDSKQAGNQIEGRGRILTHPRFQWGKLVPITGAIAAVILIALLSPALLDSFHNDAWRASAWWVDRFPQLEPSERVQRCREVFDRVASVADKPPGLHPRLVLLDIPSGPLAFSLADGSVFVGRGTLDLAYQGTSPQAGDHRMALLFGHEIRHLVQGQDFSAFAASGLLDDEARPEIRRALRRVEGLRDKELSADRWGLVYAAMAGFDPDIVLAQGQGFFEEWASQVTSESAYDDHPNAQQRATFLAGVLRGVREDLDYFHWGVRLYQIGRFEESVSFLERFRESFPSREVDNNLGLAHYQLASRILSGCDGRLVTRFMLPALLDPQTLLDRNNLRGEPPSCLDRPGFAEEIRRAEESLTNARDKDLSYLPARLNLVSTYIVSNRLADAYLSASDALELSPDDVDAQQAMILSDYAFSAERSQLQGVDEAILGMQRLVREHPQSSTAVYNLAAMLQEQGQIDEARQHWHAFLELQPTGPRAHYVREDRLREPGIEPPTALGAPSPPIPLGTMSESTRALLADFQSRRIEIGDFALHRNNTVSILVDDNSILALEERSADVQDPAGLPAKYGTPIQRFAAPQRQTWLYDGFGFEVEEGRVKKTFFYGRASE